MVDSRVLRGQMIRQSRDSLRRIWPDCNRERQANVRLVRFPNPLALGSASASESENLTNVRLAFTDWKDAKSQQTPRIARDALWDTH